MKTSLVFDKTSRHYGPVKALQDLTLRCPAGEALCLVGPNGSGKSTSLALAAGLMAPTAGSLRWEEEGTGRTLAGNFGYLPQESRFPGRLTVQETLRFCAEARGTNAAQLEEVLEAAGLVPVMDRMVGELSGGWTRRLGLAWALMPPSSFYLLDEPFVGLDPLTLDRILDYLRLCLKQGVGVLLASHEFEIVDRLSPAVAVLEEGKLAGHINGPCSSARAFYEKALRPANPAALRRVS